jgi:transposase
MTRRYGRAPKGERAYGSVPRNRGKNTTLLASISLEGMGEAMTVEGSTTQKVFEAYVEKVLAPTLKPGQVVILDNLGAHKGEKVKQLIESRAASVIFLPAYSPDFNPIEEAFSKIKAILKKMAARAREALIEAIGRALEAVTSQDAWGWFAHCGYVHRDQPS